MKHTPVIGQDLFHQLSNLCEAARAAARNRNFHAAALYVALEALKIQAEQEGSHVTVLIGGVSK